ncbi:hypothetical protein JHW43_007737, partial [Diplocarpon mali]
APPRFGVSTAPVVGCRLQSGGDVRLKAKTGAYLGSSERTLPDPFSTQGRERLVVRLAYDGNEERRHEAEEAEEDDDDEVVDDGLDHGCWSPRGETGAVPTREGVGVHVGGIGGVGGVGGRGGL